MSVIAPSQPANKNKLFLIPEAIKDMLASVVGSAACVYTGQPFDTVKVRMQVQPGEFNGPLHCFRETMWGEGITKLWSGSLPAFTGALLENAVAFSVNGLLKRIIEGDDARKQQETQKSFFEPFLTGGITGMFTAVVLCPCDVIKCRAQLSKSTGGDSRIRAVVGNLIRSKGMGGLYLGFHAQVMRDIPFYATFFGSYEIICRLLRANTQWSDAAVYFTAGGLAGQIGWAASIVPDTIKSQIQTSQHPLSISKTFAEIYAQRGLRGLFMGLEVAIVRAFPANAALFVGYEV